MTVAYAIVVPTTGRPELARLVDALAAQAGPRPERVAIVDDRGDGAGAALDLGTNAGSGWLADADGDPRARVAVVAGPGRGPAAARNRGWRGTCADWVAFLDDDVVPAPDWSERLVADLERLPAAVAASQGRIEVPLPADRRRTDRERCVAGLDDAVWATADMAYRRAALDDVGGFDERFPRAYREDADLGLRVLEAGHGIVRGGRTVVHPVGEAGPWASVRLQAGNADDVLMRALHGPGWRERAGAPPGRRPRHLATVAAGAAGAIAAATGRRRLAAAGGAAWALGTAELAWARIAPGPRTSGEVATMLATSAVLPPAAALHTARGLLTLPRKLRGSASRAWPRPRAVLLDRDGTLVADVPYNGDPDAVRPMAGAADAVARLREAGIATAVISNQSGIGRGVLTADRVDAVNRRVERLVGPVGPWLICPHAPDEGCDCRKPAPGLVLRAADLLGVDPADCAVVGDVGADVGAALAAGARSILVPTPQTRPEEIDAAPEVVSDLEAAVDRLLGEVAGHSTRRPAPEAMAA
ncbi:MAG: HAD-IIIA family hydrolase [Thermoleophilaceae bacterium]